ncbi:MAG: hypothetical protein IT186_13485 [Acidobacteria bacterium]|nr:hypothetical protein [Acidobacteriota bacterium]MCG3195285.1 hypothetical protein [Thermoanaerobaculia bacterium]
MNELIYPLIDLLYRLPKPVKYLGAVMLGVPICIVIMRLMGVERYWWIAVLGGIVIAGAVALFEGIRSKSDRSKGAEFAGELQKDAQKPGASKQEVRQALKELSDKWTEALGKLQGTGLNVYSLPWYLLIGEPQSGKSTTLKNSGLEFPVGDEGLSGSGGTRNCDWWFANEAVILDTAGRFTFQEEAAPDQAEWSTFLKLLRRYRGDCPINGVLIVIPCTSLLEDSPEEQDRKAQNIRSKLLHLQRVLEIRFPIFMMITKADRILGFSEFFSKLDPVDQRQLFGWSAQGGIDTVYDPAAFENSFEDMIGRMHRLRLKFTSSEENVATVDKLFAFPEELRALKDPLKKYFNVIFQKTRYDEPLVFRGYYISSGVQQGKPIARAMRELLGTSADAMMENLEQIFKRSRAFFIKDFYEKKVFPEQGLVAKTRAAAEKDKRNLWLFRGLLAALIILVLGGLLPAYLAVKNVVEPIRRVVTQAEECWGDKPKPCTVLKAYEVSVELHRQRQLLQDQGFWRRVSFALFFRGSKGELDELLRSVQGRLYMARVVSPLLKESEARMGAINWETFDQYPLFFQSFESYLKWWWMFRIGKPLDPNTKPPVAPENLDVMPMVKVAAAMKGANVTEKSKEIDEWVGKLGSDPVPDRILQSIVQKGMPADKASWDVKDPERPVATFERYWTIENLARWDFRLVSFLEKYVLAYKAMVALDDPNSRSHLDRAAQIGKEFKGAYDAVTKHLTSPRPGAVGFPGANLEEWKKNLEAEYAKLYKYQDAVEKLKEERMQEIRRVLEEKAKNLESSQGLYAHLVMIDPADATKAKRKWTPAAEGLSPLLVEVTAYADIAAFEAAEHPQQVLEEALRLTTPGEQKGKLEAFSNKQRDLKVKAVEKQGAVIGAIPPEQKGAFVEPPLNSFITKTAELALIYRVLPTAQKFVGDAKIIGAGCTPNICFSPGYAKEMVGYTISVIKFAEVSSVATRPDVDQMTGATAQIAIDYLIRYIDHFAGRVVVPRPSGGGGFSIPTRARNAVAWSEFQRAIMAWNPEGGGGGGDEAAAAPQPQVDMSGKLSFSDVDAFANQSTRFVKVRDYFRSKEQKAVAPRPSGGSAKTPPEIIQAAQKFKACVSVLNETPLTAWKQLSRAQDGASLRDYHAFTRAPAVRRHPVYGDALVAVERKGANLIREAIRGPFQQRSEPVWQKLKTTVMGTFPFISQSEIREKRRAYDLAPGEPGNLFKPGPAGAGSVTLKLEFPTINQTQISGPLSDVGALADEYALDPILWGGEPDFDFVGDPQRNPYNVARRWQRFLFRESGAGGIKEHKIDMRALQTTAYAGRKFMGDRIGSLLLFGTGFRPSTDVKTGAGARPYMWRLPSGEQPMEIIGRNEDVGKGWTGRVELIGGPLRFYYYVLVASEPRAKEELMEDPEKQRERERTWVIRVVVPDAERMKEALEGLFELVFSEPMPNVLPG